jgi:hypothetical protein
MKSAKTKEKENRSFTGDPGVSKNHATAHKHYSYESVVRIWNPELFLISTRDPCLLLVTGAEDMAGFWTLLESDQWQQRASRRPGLG